MLKYKCARFSRLQLGRSAVVFIIPPSVASAVFKSNTESCWSSVSYPVRWKSGVEIPVEHSCHSVGVFECVRVCVCVCVSLCAHR